MNLIDFAILFGYPLALFVIGFLIERRLQDTAPMFSISEWVRVIAAGVALGGPWLLYWSGYLRGLPVPADSFIPLTLAVVLWLMVTRLFGVGTRGQNSPC